MKNQKENILNGVGRIFFLFLFFFAVSFFFNKPVKTSIEAAKCELSANSFKAVIETARQVIISKKANLPSNFKRKFDLNDKRVSLPNVNAKITHSIISVNNKLRSVPSNSECRFYFHLFPISDEDPSRSI